jgi:hypothetical protein
MPTQRRNAALQAFVLSLLCFPVALAECSAVKVSTDKSSYDPGEMIAVSIVNTLSVPIYALTGQTYCTIVTVERSINSKWKSEGACQSYAPPGWVEIAAGATTKIEVMPRLPADQPLPAGRYRARLTFKVGSTNGRSATVLSSEVLISKRRP